MNRIYRHTPRAALALLAALLAGLLATAGVLAGGWAVISVEPLPDGIQPGQPFSIQFTVLQHGQTPMVGLDPGPTVQFTGANGEKLTFDAAGQPDPGVYRAEVTLPAAGEWDWSVQAFTVVQAMPPLQLEAAGAANAAAAPGLLLETPALIAGLMLAGAVLLLGSAVYLYRKPARQLAPLLVVLGLALAAGALLTGRQALASEPASPPEAVSELQPAEYGDAVFTARGCVTCHTHRGVSVPASHEINWGPDLTNFQASPEYLRMWLSDPQSVRPTAEMPDLGLQDGEIEALIAFLNQDETR